MKRRFLPDIPSGFELFKGTTNFSVVIPEETTNLIYNPSFEYGTSYYSTTGTATLSRSMTNQKNGLFSLRVDSTVAGSGVKYLTPQNLTGGHTYTFSLYLWGRYPYMYKMAVMDGGALIAQKRFEATSGQQRASLTFTAPYTGQFSLYLTSETRPDIFYTDSWQLEEKTYMTSYCDGDMAGYVVGEIAYRWNGARHLSPSYRVITTASGGREYDLYSLGFHITGIVGLGMPPTENITSALSGGGEYYQVSRLSAREFSLVGNIYGSDFQQLSKNRSALIDAFSINRAAYQQPLLLKYKYTEPGVKTIELGIRCLYESGLEMNITNPYAEQVELRFKMVDPDLEGEIISAQEFGYSSNTGAISGGPEAGGLMMLDNTNTFSTVSTDLFNMYSIPRHAAVMDFDGTVLLGGNTTQNYICRYTGAGLSSVGNGFNGNVSDLCRGPGKAIYACGLFTKDSTLATNLLGVARWNGTAWEAVSSNNLIVAGEEVRSIVVTSTNIIYALKKTAAGSYIYKAVKGGGSSTTWTLVGTVLAAAGEIWDIGLNERTNDIYVCGSFKVIEGCNTAGFVKYNGSAWTDMSTGFDTVNPLITYVVVDHQTGLPYAKGNDPDGNFGVFRWNGSQWVILSPFPPAVSPSIYLGENNILYSFRNNLVPSPGGGYVTIDDQLAMSDIMYWTGSQWRSLQFTVCEGLSVANPPWADLAFAFEDGRMLVIVGAGQYTIIQGQSTAVSITNTKCSPAITIEGPYELNELKNFSTGSVLKFKDLKAEFGERIVITINRNGTAIVRSSIRGNMNYTVIGGTNARFWFKIGTNILGFSKCNDFTLFSDPFSDFSAITLSNLSIQNIPNQKLYGKVTVDGSLNRQWYVYADAARTQLVCNSDLNERYMKTSGAFCGGNVKGSVYTTAPVVDTNFDFAIGGMYITLTKQVSTLDEAFE